MLLHLKTDAVSGTITALFDDWTTLAASEEDRLDLSLGKCYTTTYLSHDTNEGEKKSRQVTVLSLYEILALYS